MTIDGSHLPDWLTAEAPLRYVTRMPLRSDRGKEEVRALDTANDLTSWNDRMDVQSREPMTHPHP